MANSTNSSKWAGAGLLSAIAASLCCITPVLALLAGSSSMATTFSWIEPLRPYLIGFTVLIIAFAWYQKLTPKQETEMDCDCEEEGKPSFWQSKAFLGIVTAFAALMLTFPYYSQGFYPESKASPVATTQFDAVKLLVLDIEGMTCTGCEAHVEHAANEIEGIEQAKASYAEGKAEISFDPSKASPEEIIKAVETTGYRIAESHILSPETN